MKVQREKSKKIISKIIIITAVILLAAVGIMLLLRTQTFSKYKVVNSEERNDDTNGTYLRFGTHLVRYTHNGIIETDSRDQVVWDQSYEMQNPMVELCGGTLAVGDIKGNQILLFNEDMQIGSVATNMPIQKFSVSEQGVVAAIIRNENRTMIMCYDARGNVLVEGKASLPDMGYPLGLAISPDGMRVMLSYITTGSTVNSRIICYDFEDIERSDQDKILFDKVYEDVLIPTVLFLNNRAGVAIGTERLLFYSGDSKWKEKKEIEVTEPIQSALREEEGIGIVYQNTEEKDIPYRMVKYSTSGHEEMKMDLDMEYSYIDMIDGQTILMQDRHCEIYTPVGRKLFDGELESAASYLMPLSGINKYLLVMPQAIQTIELKK